MDYKKYQIIYAPDVLEKLKEIRDYISQNYSSTSGQRKMEQIISDIENSRFSQKLVLMPMKNMVQKSAIITALKVTP